MGDVSISEVLGVALGYVLAQLVRYLYKQRFWSRVMSTARRYIESPDVAIDDPHEAARAALLDEQRPQVERVARALRDSASPIPRVGPDDDTPRLITIVRKPDSE